MAHNMAASWEDDVHSAEEHPSEPGYSKVEILGLQSDITSDDLKIYFETAKSGGRKGSVLNCVIEEDGKAYIEFDCPEVAANVIRKESHDIAGDQFTVQYPSEPAAPLSSILLSQLPTQVDLEFLKGKLELPIGHSEFSIEKQDDYSAVLNVSKHMSNTELENMVKNLNEIKIKRKRILATLLPTSKCLQGPAMNDSDCTSNAENPTRFCNAKLLISQLPMDDENPGYTETLIENVIKCTCSRKDHCFEIEHQGDTLVVTFTKCLSEAELKEIVTNINQTKMKNSTAHCEVANLSAALPLEILLIGFNSRTDDKYIAMCIEDATEMKHNADFTFTRHGNDSVLIQLMNSLPRKDLDILVKGIRSTLGKEQKLTVAMHQTLPEKPQLRTEKPQLRTEKPQLQTEPLNIQISNILESSLIVLTMRLEDHCNKTHGTDFTLQPQKEGSALLIITWNPTQKELEEVIAFINSISIKEKNLKAELCKTPAANDGFPILLLKWSSPIDEHVLALGLEAATKQDRDKDFVLDMLSECSATVTFQKHLTDQELQRLKSNIEGKFTKKGGQLTAEVYQCPLTIHIRNITKNYDEELLRYYFETTKRSGGGKVKSVKLQQTGEAVIEFQDQSVLKRVLQQSHNETLGIGVIVEQETSHALPAKCASVCAIHHRPMIMPFSTIPPDLIKIELGTIQNLLNDFHVKAEMNKEGLVLSPCQSTPIGWETVCRDRINDFIRENILEIQLDISEKALAILLPTVIHIQTTNKCLSFTPAQGLKSSVYTFIGERSIIEKIKDDLDKINNSITVTTEQFCLDEKTFAFISEFKKRTIEMANPNLEITYETSSKISAHGVLQNIKQLWSYISGICCSSISVEITDLHVLEFLRSEKGLNQIKLFINDQCHNSAAVAVYQSVNSICLLCEPDQEPLVKTMATVAKNELCCRRILISTSFVQYLLLEKNQKGFDDFCEQQKKVLIKQTNKELIIVGLKRPVQECFDILTEFIEDKCKVHKAIKIDQGTWRLFQGHGSLNTGWKKVKDTKIVKITCPQGNVAKDPVIALEGSIDNVQHIYDQIIELKEAVVVKTISESQPGLMEYMKTPLVCTLIRGIESEQCVCIEYKDEHTVPLSKSAFNMHRHREVFLAYTKEHKKVCVCIGDITEFKADVLVNAANKDLKHIGGVAKGFLDRGGSIIQEACDRYNKHHRNRLEDGKVWLSTDVGALPCKALIHAVAPKFTKGMKCDSEKGKLFKAYYNAMDEANTRGYHSIAFPAISAGVYDCPYEVSVQKWIEAAIKFSNKFAAKALNDIYFIATDDVTANVVIAAMNSKAEEFADLGTSTAINVQSNSTAVMQSQKPIFEYLKLLKQSLIDIRADVYVNTTTTTLAITSGGAISSLLAKAAGPQLEQECSKKAPIMHGDVAVTGAGGTLKCQNIFHIALPQQYKQGHSEEVLYNSIKKCLTECNRLKHSSIAFPALGTGTLKYPPDIISDIMIKATVEYMSSNANCSITAVYFAIYKDESLYGIFQRALNKIQATTVTCGTKEGATSKDVHGDGSTATHVQGSYMINNITVNILNGDITDVSSDVIVNSSSSDMKLACTSVGKALLKKVGSPLQNECDAFIAKSHELKSGTVACTHTCGSLKCKVVFHVHIDQAMAIPDTVRMCLDEAEAKGYSSISLPAMGTGGHQCPSDIAAGNILDGINLFTSSRKLQSLNTIQIVVYLPEMYQVFLDTFNRSQSYWITSAVKGIGATAVKGIGAIIGSVWGRDARVEETKHEQYHMEQQWDDTMPAAVTFTIYGETDETVESAEAKMYELIQKTFQPRSIESAVINELSSTEVQELKKFSDDNNVTIKIHPDPLNEIILNGEATNVAKVYSFVQTALANHEKRKLMKEQAERMLGTTEWQHENPDGSFTSYDVLENYDIEKAYELNSNGEYVRDNGCKIDFATKTYYDANGRTWKLHRLDKIAHGCPPEWDRMPLDQTNREVRCHLFSLQSSSTEYKHVLDAFSKTMTQGVNYKQIMQIQRVQNPALYHNYITMKTDMDKSNPPNHKNERKLFHGTAFNSCEKINAQGFNRTFAGKNATFYGRGVYFARDACYSAQEKYSPPDASGNKYMYLASVLTGEYALGKSDTIVPPAKDPINNPNVLFDSTVENVQDPTIFVTYHDAQVYPEYLITFRC